MNTAKYILLLISLLSPFNVTSSIIADGVEAKKAFVDGEEEQYTNVDTFLSLEKWRKYKKWQESMPPPESGAAVPYFLGFWAYVQTGCCKIDGFHAMPPYLNIKKTQGKPTFFEGPPCGIQLGSHGPLRTGEGLVQALIVKTFILTRISKGFSITISACR